MAQFFQTVGGISEEELILLISQIGYDFAFSLPVDSLCRTLLKMAKMKREMEIRMQWTIMLPFMSMGLLKYMSFEDYLAQCTGKNLDMRPSVDILAEVDEIRKKMKGES